MAPRRTPAPAQPATQAELLTVKQAAAVLSVSRTTVYKLIHDGDLLVVYIGSDIRIPRSEIERFIEHRKQRAS